MVTRREFLGMVGGAAAVGAVAPVVAATERAAGAVTFSTIGERQRYQYAAHSAAHIWRRLRYPHRLAPPLPPAEREALMNEWEAFNRQQLEYKMMRLNQPDIVDSPETLAELARRMWVPVEQVTSSLPWHNLPEEPFIVLTPDGHFLTTMRGGVMLYVPSTSTFQGY